MDFLKCITESFNFQNVVRKIENQSTDSGDHPKKKVVIKKSGSLPVETPFSVTKDDADE